MNIKRLIIDTSSPVLLVVVSEGLKILSELKMPGARRHATYIVAAVDEALEKGGITIGEIDEIIVGEGPGSYTGLRAGLTVSKMFSYTLKKPLYKINSFSLLTSGYNADYVVNSVIRLNSHTGFNTKTKEGKLMENIKTIKFLEIANNENIILIDEDTIKINIKSLLPHIEIVDDINSFVPNYHLELVIW